MPYIVTTKRTVPTDLGRDEVADAGVLSRRAVATLEAILQYGSDQGWRRATVRAVASFPESGGTVGPLPDGTVIEVEPIAFSRLYDEVFTVGVDPPTTPTKLCDAYNARQA
jgi:hypothetical protein